MPRWVWWVLLAIVLVLIWRGQGAAVGRGIGRMVGGIFTAIDSINFR